MPGVAGQLAGEAFVRVPAFAGRAGRELDHSDEIDRRRTRGRYVAERLACMAMNRQFWPELAARRVARHPF